MPKPIHKSPRVVEQELLLSMEKLEGMKLATKADTDAILDSISELTKAISDLTKENVKWYRAGKM